MERWRKIERPAVSCVTLAFRCVARAHLHTMIISTLFRAPRDRCAPLDLQTKLNTGGEGELFQLISCHVETCFFKTTCRKQARCFTCSQKCATGCLSQTGDSVGFAVEKHKAFLKIIASVLTSLVHWSLSLNLLEIVIIVVIKEGLELFNQQKSPKTVWPPRFKASVCGVNDSFISQEDHDWDRFHLKVKKKLHFG